MDNRSPDIGALIGALSQNPALLSVIGSLTESLQNQSKTETAKNADLSPLLGLLGAKEQNKTTEASPFGSKEDIKNRIALLDAVKPFLSEQRRERLDLIIKLLKLSELGELTGLLGKMS